MTVPTTMTTLRRNPSRPALAAHSLGPQPLVLRVARTLVQVLAHCDKATPLVKKLARTSLTQVGARLTPETPRRRATRIARTARATPAIQGLVLALLVGALDPACPASALVLARSQSSTGGALVLTPLDPQHPASIMTPALITGVKLRQSARGHGCITALITTSCMTSQAKGTWT